MTTTSLDGGKYRPEQDLKIDESYSHNQLVEDLKTRYISVMFLSHSVILKHSIDCPELKLEEQEGLQAIGHVTNKMSATATFSCGGNYEMIGPSFIECMPTGEWSGKQPKCIASGQPGFAGVVVLQDSMGICCTVHSSYQLHQVLKSLKICAW
ncbi:hypothetical protein GQR58_020268 [Nymphon striatum]|nr:hypothetical protein GQR58_020268 [Nymphon striatum]